MIRSLPVADNLSNLNMDLATFACVRNIMFALLIRQSIAVYDSHAANHTESTYFASKLITIIDNYDRKITPNTGESIYFASKLNEIINNYDRKVRPNTGGPVTNVQVEIKIVTFGPIDEAKQEFSLDVFFRQWWHDPSLNGAVNKTLTMAINPGSIFWIPDTYFVNAKDPKFQLVTKEAMRVVLKPNGDLYYSSRIMMSARCPMDFTFYPFDAQVCPLVIESYSYTTEDVFYSWYESKGKLRKTKGVEWIASQGPLFELAHVSSFQKQISNNSKGAFSSLKIEFHLKRRIGFYVGNTFLPGGILVIMSWVNFWIPQWAYPARVTVTLTSFLSTLVVMSSASNQLGQVSYVKAIDYFLFGNATFILLNLLEYCMVLHPWFDVNLDFLKKFRNKKEDKKSEANLSDINECCDHENGAAVIQMKERTHNNSFDALSERFPKNNSMQKSTSLTSLTEDAFWGTDRSGNENKPRHRKASTTLATKQFQEKYDLTPEQANETHPLDYLSRYVFSSCYALFVLCYCAYFELL